MQELAGQVTGITSDSREVRKGYAFVAYRGETHDGHNFIDQAIQRGAQVILYEDEVPASLNIPDEVQLVRVADGREVLATLAALHYGRPDQDLHTVGVTGTNGKTTTTHMIQHILGESGRSCGLIGTVQTSTGLATHPPSLTTPGAVKIAGYLAEMRSAGLTHAVLEVSSHALAMKRVAAIDMDVGVFTNLAADHLDFHETTEDYAAAKRKLLRMPGPGGVAVVNADDDWAEFMTRGCQAQLVTFGTTPTADLQVTGTRTSRHGIQVDWRLNRPVPVIEDVVAKPDRIQPGRYQTAIPVIGEHNAENASAAACAAMACGVPLEEVTEALQTFDGVWRRLQVTYDHGYVVIDDAAHNPANYQAVLSAVQELDYNRLFIVNAIRGNRGMQVVRDIASTLRRWCDDLHPALLTHTACRDVAKRNDYVSAKEKRLYLRAFQGYDWPSAYYDELHQALYTVHDRVDPGDLVLLLGPHAMDTASEMWGRISSQSTTRLAVDDVLVADQ